MWTSILLPSLSWATVPVLLAITDEYDLPNLYDINYSYDLSINSWTYNGIDNTAWS